MSMGVRLEFAVEQELNGKKGMEAVSVEGQVREIRTSEWVNDK